MTDTLVAEISTPEQPRRLYHAWGLIEGLFQFAAKHAPDGALGKFSNAQIAKRLDWDGEGADSLISAMVTAGILTACDCCPAHRIVITDWHSNMPEMTRKWLKRNKMEVNTSCETKKRTRSAKRSDAVRTESAADADNFRIEPNQTVPNRTEPNQTESNKTESNRTESGNAPTAPPGAAAFALPGATDGTATGRSDGTASGKTPSAGGGEGEAAILAAELHEALGLPSPAEMRGVDVDPEDRRQFEFDLRELRDVLAPLILREGRRTIAIREAMASAEGDVPIALFKSRLRRFGFEIPTSTGRSGYRRRAAGGRR